MDFPVRISISCSIISGNYLNTHSSSVLSPFGKAPRHRRGPWNFTGLKTLQYGLGKVSQVCGERKFKVNKSLTSNTTSAVCLENWPYRLNRFINTQRGASCLLAVLFSPCHRALALASAKEDCFSFIFTYIPVSWLGINFKTKFSGKLSSTGGMAQERNLGMQTRFGKVYGKCKTLFGRSFLLVAFPVLMVLSQDGAVFRWKFVLKIAPMCESWNLFSHLALRI